MTKQLKETESGGVNASQPGGAVVALPARVEQQSFFMPRLARVEIITKALPKGRQPPSRKAIAATSGS